MLEDEDEEFAETWKNWLPTRRGGKETGRASSNNALFDGEGEIKCPGRGGDDIEITRVKRGARGFAAFVGAAVRQVEGHNKRLEKQQMWEKKQRMDEERRLQRDPLGARRRDDPRGALRSEWAVNQEDWDEPERKGTPGRDRDGSGLQRQRSRSWETVGRPRQTNFERRDGRGRDRRDKDSDWVEREGQDGSSLRRRNDGTSRRDDWKRRRDPEEERQVATRRREERRTTIYLSARKKEASLKAKSQLDVYQADNTVWKPDKFYSEVEKEERPWVDPSEVMERIGVGTGKGVFLDDEDDLTPKADDSEPEEVEKKKRRKKIACSGSSPSESSDDDSDSSSDSTASCLPSSDDEEGDSKTDDGETQLIRSRKQKKRKGQQKKKKKRLKESEKIRKLRKFIEKERKKRRRKEKKKKLRRGGARAGDNSDW